MFIRQLTLKSELVITGRMKIILCIQAQSQSEDTTHVSTVKTIDWISELLINNHF